MSDTSPDVPGLVVTLNNGSCAEQQSALVTLSQLACSEVDADNAHCIVHTPGAISALVAQLTSKDVRSQATSASILLWLIHHAALDITGLATLPGLVAGLVAAARCTCGQESGTTHVDAVTILTALTQCHSNRRLLGHNEAVLAVLGHHLCRGSDNTLMQAAQALSNLAADADTAQYILETTDAVAWLVHMLRSPAPGPAASGEALTAILRLASSGEGNRRHIVWHQGLFPALVQLMGHSNSLGKQATAVFVSLAPKLLTRPWWTWNDTVLAPLVTLMVTSSRDPGVQLQAVDGLRSLAARPVIAGVLIAAPGTVAGLVVLLCNAAGQACVELAAAALADLAAHAAVAGRQQLLEERGLMEGLVKVGEDGSSSSTAVECASQALVALLSSPGNPQHIHHWEDRLIWWHSRALITSSCPGVQHIAVRALARLTVSSNDVQRVAAIDGVTGFLQGVLQGMPADQRSVSSARSSSKNQSEVQQLAAKALCKLAESALAA
jgi:hypothetical protein